MRNVKVSIWGRLFDLKVCHDHFDDDTIPSDMVEARDSLLASWEAVEDALPELKRYCSERNPNDVAKLYGNNGVDNIFRMAVPDCLYVLPSTEARRVALMLNYRFDLEEGLALLFINEKLASIGPQSDVF